MVQAPTKLLEVGELPNVRTCTRCSLHRTHTPQRPFLKVGALTIIGPYPDSWETTEVGRLIRLMKVGDEQTHLSTVYCQSDSPTNAQRAQCQTHVENFMRVMGDALVVVVGRMAPVSLGFDNRAVLSGRVGIWHDPADERAGTFCLFVDAPDGHNNHKILDQLFPLPRLLAGDLSLMELVGVGKCAFGNCGLNVRWLDKTGIPWCRRHQWGGENDGRVVKVKKKSKKKGK